MFGRRPCSTSIQLTWSWVGESGQTIERFDVFRNDADGADPAIPASSLRFDPRSGGYYSTDVGRLEGGRTYIFTLAIWLTSGQFPDSGERAPTTQTTAPTAIDSDTITASQDEDDFVDLAWGRPARPVDGDLVYTVYMPGTEFVFEDITDCSVPQGASEEVCTYRVTGLEAGATFRFTITSTSVQGGESDQSDPVSGQTFNSLPAITIQVPPTYEIEGMAVYSPGRLTSCTVFLDLDEDGRLGRGEPQTVTDRNGVWVITTSIDPDQEHDPRWKFILLPGRMCMDGTTGSSISSSMFVYHPDSLISPLSTLEATMEGAGMSRDAAVSNIDRRYSVDAGYDFLSKDSVEQVADAGYVESTLANAMLASSASMIGNAIRPQGRGGDSGGGRGGGTSGRGGTGRGGTPPPPPGRGGGGRGRRLQLQRGMNAASVRRQTQDEADPCDETPTDADMAALLYGNMMGDALEPEEEEPTGEPDPDADPCSAQCTGDVDSAGDACALNSDESDCLLADGDCVYVALASMADNMPCADEDTKAGIRAAEANSCLVSQMIAAMAGSNVSDPAALLGSVASLGVAVSNLATAENVTVMSADALSSAVASAVLPVWGCTNLLSSNYASNYTHDDGSCILATFYGSMDYTVGMNCTVSLDLVASYPEMDPLDLAVDDSFVELNGDYSFVSYTNNATTYLAPDGACIDRSTGQPLTFPLAAPAYSAVLSPVSTVKNQMMRRWGLSSSQADSKLYTAFSIPSGTSMDDTRGDALPAQCTGATNSAGDACALNTEASDCLVADGDCAYVAAVPQIGYLALANTILMSIMTVGVKMVNGLVDVRLYDFPTEQIPLLNETDSCDPADPICKLKIGRHNQSLNGWDGVYDSSELVLTSIAESIVGTVTLDTIQTIGEALHPILTSFGKRPISSRNVPAVKPRAPDRLKPLLLVAVTQNGSSPACSGCSSRWTQTRNAKARSTTLSAPAPTAATLGARRRTSGSTQACSSRSTASRRSSPK